MGASCYGTCPFGLLACIKASFALGKILETLQTNPLAYALLLLKKL
ncbi:MAG: hypothetical protein FWD52_06925 [Candidatus Bathyarchaeota archaeon]|nr:hypothetical protein [Candidatus Termiticorpusculum sp.]